MPFQWVLLEMALEGVTIDLSLLHKQQDILQDEILNLKKDLYDTLNERYTLQMPLDPKVKPTLIGKINFNSSQQLIEIFNKLGLEIKEKTEKGNPSVGVKTMEKHKNNPFVETLTKYKIASKLYNGFVGEDGQIISNLESDGKVRPNVNDVGTKTGRLSMSQPNCLHEDTEVLTKYNGWVSAKTISLNDEIASYNEETDEIEFEYPLRLTKGYTLYGWHIHNQHIDMICTDNHRHLLFNRKTNKQIIPSPTGSNFTTDSKFKNAGIYNSVKEDEWIQKIVCAIQADGYIIKDNVDFKFTKKRKYERLKELLNGFNYSDYSNSNAYRIYIKLDKKIWGIIEKYMDRKTKTFTPLIVTKFGKAFFEELRYWDGLYTRDFGERYCSMNKTNVSLVQAVCTLQGYRSLVSSDGMRVSVTNKDYSLTTNVNIEETNGFNYWCATMPNDTLLVRRNGKVWITKNCQQLPKPKSYAPVNVRSVFTAPKGYKMFSCDYSGQEVAVMAQQSKDPTLVKALNNGYDMHLAVANTFYELKIPEDCLSTKHPEYHIYKEKYSKERSLAKTITFGLAYGKGAYGFAKDFNIEEEEAQVLVDNYFKGMSVLKEAINKAHKELEDTGVITHMAGRKRHFNLTEDSEFWEIESAKRKAFNFQIQGFSADMIRAASVNVHRRKDKFKEWDLKAIMTVHDEFVYIVKEAFVMEATTLVKGAFEDVCKNFVVPVNADIEIGENYGNSK
jgi:DNA polymerase I-like protein with 3'-5' exonuclease and polymerase domains